MVPLDWRSVCSDAGLPSFARYVYVYVMPYARYVYVSAHLLIYFVLVSFQLSKDLKYI